MRAFLLVLVLAAPASAEPILLFELEHIVDPDIFTLGPPPERLDYFFGAGAGLGISWEIAAGADDVGRIYTAPANQVADLNYDLNRSDILYLGAHIENADSSIQFSLPSAAPEGMIDAGNRRLVATLHVQSLADYRITSVDRSVDFFFVQPIPQSEGFFYGGAQTLRFYGELVPEPGTFVLLLAYCFAGSFVQRC